MQEKTSLWARFAEWAGAAGQPQDMTLEWTCCGTPRRDPVQAWLGRVDAFELAVHACVHCGTLWLDIHSMATAVTRSEPLRGTDAEAFLVADPGTDRRAVIKTWLQRRLRPAGSHLR